MRRETVIGLIDKKRELLEQGDSVEDAEAFVGGVADLYESNPAIEADPELRQKAIEIDDALREAGDRRAYSARYADISDAINGTVDPLADQLGDALASGDPVRTLAAVRVLRHGNATSLAVDPEGPEHNDVQATIGVMASARANVQVARALAGRTAVALGLKDQE